MKFDKQQKKKLNKMKLWKRVKELTEEAGGICTTPELSTAFSWSPTEEGHAYWDAINEGLQCT